MQTINIIIENLRAMGAKPETIKRPNGETVIKINAPAIDGAKGAQNNEKAKN